MVLGFRFQRGFGTQDTATIRYIRLNAWGVMVMPVRSIRNQYRGVNAHLHSMWQAEGTWNRFQNMYIAALNQALRAQLRPLGYIAQIEEGLQIRRIGEPPLRPRSDVAIRDLNPPHQAAGRGVGLLESAFAIPELDLDAEDNEHSYMAVALYARDDDEDGRIVGWLELLSPSNKGDGDDAATYRAKRRLLLEQGIVFIEIDLLHESKPTYPRFVDYSNLRLHAGAHPYRILILEPRPTYRESRVGWSEFDIDEPLPTKRVPLSGDESIYFDFNAPYQKLFVDTFYGDEVDYAQLPQHFECYRSADQMRIARRMISVLRAAARGDDLERGPFEIEEIGLEAALTEIASISA